MPMQTDTELLQMALVGLTVELHKIQSKIEEIQGRLNGRTSGATGTPTPHTRRSMSAAGRKRIAAAQKARWAAFRKKQKAA